MLGQYNICVCTDQQERLHSQEVKGCIVQMGVCAMSETKCLGAKVYQIKGFTLDVCS